MARRKRTFDVRMVARAERMLIVMLIIFAIGMAAAVMVAGARDVWSHMAKLPLSTLCFLVLCNVLNVFLRGARWPLFAAKIHLKVPARRIWLYYLAGNAMVVTPGKMGAALRLLLLQKGHGVPYRKSVPLMMMDPITDLVALVLMAVTAQLAVFGTHGSGSMALWIFGGITFAIVFLFSQPFWVMQLIKLGYRSFGKRGKKFWAVLQKIVRTLTVLVSPAVFGGSIMLSILGWLSVVAGLMLVLSNMGHPVPFTVAMFLYSLPIIIGGASMMPGGLGATEGTMFGLMLLVDIPADVAVAAIAIIRLFTLWLGVGLGLCMLPLALKRVRS